MPGMLSISVALAAVLPGATSTAAAKARVYDPRAG
jgi:hypothetical protein